ncbi:MAG: response regulator transcription factor [Verrucomicrobiales bacterium]|nr:response regulator transcription factor [Verrucomicrobiales bacterium]
MKGHQPKARIYLVDDHPIVRRGFQLLLSIDRDMVVCGEAESAEIALAQIPDLNPDLAVVDLGLRTSSGLDLIKQLRQICPKVKLLVFSMHDEPLFAERALRAGAQGYITKEEGTERALEAIRAVLAGRTFVSERLASRVLETMTAPGNDSKEGSVESLSDRELQVFEMIGRGLASTDIAERMHISIKTVESHRQHIKTKLGIRRANELHQQAFAWVQGRRTGT